MKLLLLAQTEDGRLYQATKDLPGGQWTAYENVDVHMGGVPLAGATNVSNAGLKSSGGGGGGFSVTRGTTDGAGLNGRLYFGSRSSSGTWDGGWTDLTSLIGQPVGGNILSQSVAATSSQTLGIHCLVIATPFMGSGTLWHSVRDPSSKHWQPWGNVNHAVHLDFAGAAEVGATLVLADLHVVVAFGRDVWLLIRHQNGRWETPFKVTTVAAFPSNDNFIPLCGVYAAGVSGELHIGLTTQSKTLHIVRHYDRTWQTSWGDVGGVLHRTCIFHGMASYGGDLHALLTDSNSGHLIHAVRHANGSWEQEDLNWIPGIPEVRTVLSLSSDY